VDLQAVDYRDPEAPGAFVRSLRETGFAVLANHPVDVARVARIYRDWTAFFQRPDAEKGRWRYDRETQDGFFPADVSERAKGHRVRDVKEFFHYYPWGRCPDALRADLQGYHDAATALAAELLGWVERHSPPEVAARYREPLSGMIAGSASTLLRVLHYPPLTGEEPEGARRAAAHADINLLTVLPAASAPGLEVLGRDGRWRSVPCDPATLVINTGDMLQEASGGWFPSTLHRVVNPDGAGRRLPRLSLPLFLHPRPEVVLSSRYTAGAYLRERLRELGVA
jgi:isopenicillin N synthase-like dioxygenase